MSFRQWGQSGHQIQKLYSVAMDTTKILDKRPSPAVTGHYLGGCLHHYRHSHCVCLGSSDGIMNKLTPTSIKKRTIIPNVNLEQRLKKSSFASSLYPRTRRKTLLLNGTPSSQYTQTSTLFAHISSTKKEFAERRIMGYSREQMFLVVSDVENYSKFLPWCESSVVTQRSLSYMEADLVIGMKPVTESYTSRVFLRNPTLIIAESNKGAHFKQMLTKWQFSPGLKAVPGSCLVDFYVSLEFISAFHANIANVFFSEVVKAMAGAFYQEAKRRYGKESVPSRKIEVVKSESDKTQF